MRNGLITVSICIIFLTGRAHGADDHPDKAVMRAWLEKPQTYARDSILISGFRKFWAATSGNEEREFIWEYLTRIAAIAETSAWPLAQANYLYIQGSEYLRRNQLYSAFDYLERSMIEFERLKDERNFGIVNNKFIPLITWNMYDNTISEEAKGRYSTYFSEALRAAEEAGSLEVVANIKITWAAYTLFVLKDYKQSLRLVNEIFELIKDQDKEKWFDYFYITMLGQSLSYLYLGNTQKGEQLLEKIVYECMLRPDFNQSQYIISQVAGFGGRYYLSRKEYKMALKYASLAENRENFMEFPYFANYLNKTFYEVYKHNDQPGRALMYLEKVRIYEEESQVEKLNQKFAEWQLKYETEQHKNKITRLENENLLKSAQQKRTLLNALLILVCTVLLAGVFMIKSNRKLQYKNKELSTKNTEITAAIFKGQTIERKRVASELHDNLNTKIAALKWRMESVEKPTPEELRIFVQILDDIYADVRLIAHNLIPSDLETVGFVVIVRKLINSLENHPINFHFSESGLSRRLPIELEYQVYNIILELINNILKHSHAAEAWINLTLLNEYLMLMVSDNGVGLKADSEGVGLANIRSRVDQLKGRISLSYPSQEGTTIQISFPVN